MRVAIVSTPFVPVLPPAYGGTELMIHHLIRGLREAGVETVLYATGDSLDPAGEVRWIFGRALWPPDPAADAAHARFALGDAGLAGCDAIHVNSPWALAVAEAGAIGAPAVCTVHHEPAPEISPVYASSRRAALVAISARQRALDPALARALVIHHGLDPVEYRFSAEGGPYVAFLGRLSPVKGPHLAIDAARRARRPVRLAGKVHPDPGAEGYFAEELRPRLALPGVE